MAFRIIYRRSDCFAGFSIKRGRSFTKTFYLLKSLYLKCFWIALKQAFFTKNEKSFRLLGTKAKLSIDSSISKICSTKVGNLCLVSISTCVPNIWFHKRNFANKRWYKCSKSNKYVQRFSFSLTSNTYIFLFSSVFLHVQWIIAVCRVHWQKSML